MRLGLFGRCVGLVVVIIKRRHEFNIGLLTCQQQSEGSRGEILFGIGVAGQDGEGTVELFG
jgi:hypothetical protein